MSDNKENPFKFEEKNKIEKLFEAKKKYFDIFFKKVNDIWSKNIIDERKMDKQIENILINVKATKSENEHIKNFLSWYT